MTIELSIWDHQKKLSINKTSVRSIVRKILKACLVKNAELSFVFVSSQKIRSLNKKFMKRAYVTDVLAFDMKDEFDKKISNSLRGDIIISTDAVIQNSKKFHSNLRREIVLYVIHGVLHLCGYDDHAPEDIKKMRAKEQALLEFLGKGIEKVVI